MSTFRNKIWEFEDECDLFELFFTEDGIGVEVLTECGTAKPIHKIPPDKALEIADIIYASYKPKQ